MQSLIACAFFEQIEVVVGLGVTLDDPVCYWINVLLTVVDLYGERMGRVGEPDLLAVVPDLQLKHVRVH